MYTNGSQIQCLIRKCRRKKKYKNRVSLEYISTSKAGYTSASSSDVGTCDHRSLMNALLTNPALPWRSVQQADEFAPLGRLAWVLVHRLQARAHAVVQHGIRVWIPALRFVPEGKGRSIHICGWGKDIRNAGIDPHTDTGVGIPGVWLKKRMRLKKDWSIKRRRWGYGGGLSVC